MKRPAYVIGAIALSIAVVFGLSLVTDGSVSANPKHTQKNGPKPHKPHKSHKPHKPHKPKHHPYPGSVQTETHCHVQSSAKRGKKVNFTYKVDADGNARPTGDVVIKVSRQSVPVRSFTEHYDGHGTQKTSLGSFSQPGQYSVNASYEPDSGSVYQPSSCGDQSFAVK